VASGVGPGGGGVWAPALMASARAAAAQMPGTRILEWRVFIVGFLFLAAHGAACSGASLRRLPTSAVPVIAAASEEKDQHDDQEDEAHDLPPREN